MFESTHPLLEAYLAPLGVTPPPEFDPDLGAEVRERLQQLDILLERITALEQKWRAEQNTDASFFLTLRLSRKSGEADLPRPTPAEQFVIEKDLLLEIKTYTEAFYYFAGRILTVLRQGSFPNLGSFECRAISDVRNHLIEHSNKKRLNIVSFGYRPGDGFVLRTARRAGQPMDLQDKGLYKNAEKFRNDLEAALRRALEAREDKERPPEGGL